MKPMKPAETCTLAAFCAEAASEVRFRSWQASAEKSLCFLPAEMMVLVLPTMFFTSLEWLMFFPCLISTVWDEAAIVRCRSLLCQQGA